jgi:hypothetical protein
MIFFVGDDSKILTVVDEHSTCASARALIFMAGSALRSPARFLHPGGRLIFHMSFVAENDLKKLSEELQKAVKGSDAYDKVKRDFGALYKLCVQCATLIPAR